MNNVNKSVVKTRASPTASTVVKLNPVRLSETSADGSTTIGGGGGDLQAVAGLYKSRRHHSRKKCCKQTPHGIAKCWAYTNLVVSIIDMLFSLYEIMAMSNGLMDSEDNNELHRTISIASIALHGDCTETAIEVVINLLFESFYVISSVLFAFATALDKEDFLISRCLVQWFIFSVWFPPFALLPRFLINIVSTCGINSARAFGPKWNEHGPRIIFWILNLAYLFFLVAWLAHSRHVASSFLHYLKEVEQRHSAMKLIQTGSGKVVAVPGSEMSVNHVGNAGDKVLTRSPLNAILPSSLPVV